MRTEKRIYNSPGIVSIEIDSEITLALESAPPIGPGEGFSLAPVYFNNDPFKTNMV
jgi:hypothetical protein